LVGATLVLTWGAAQTPEIPFDKAVYETRLPLTTWLDPVELAEAWQDRKVFLEEVFLIAEGPRQDELYATSCETSREAAPAQEALGVRCPWVYLGKLQPDEARERLRLIGGRKVAVYFTVGQIVPRRFARQFGMLESKHGAWVEVDDETFHIAADARVFNLPEDEAAAEAAETTAAPSTAQEAQAYFSFEYRLVDAENGQAARNALRPLSRSSILGGRTEFVVETSAPEWFSVERVVVTGHEGIYRRDGRLELCASSTAPNSCVADFGPGVARQRFTVEAAVRNVDGARFTVARDFATLDTHPHRIGTASSGTRRAPTEPSPRAEVVRLVRLETDAGGGEAGRVGYRVDLPPELFRVDIAGIEGATVKSVTPPLAARPSESVPLLIPIFLNVSPYFSEGREGGPALGWLPSYAGEDGGIVRKLRHGLEWAAWSGVDAEFVVVDYAATARMFGPFRLHTGRDLSDDQKAHNRSTLDGLADHLRQPPLPEWRRRRQDAWASDVRHPLFTLNDLCFKAHPGLVAALLVTDGRDNPIEPRPRFLPELWPERLAELDRALTPERADAILGALDEEGGLRDEAIGRLNETAEENGDPALSLLAEYLRALETGGTATPHPHAEGRPPPMDALIVPGPSAPRRERPGPFHNMIREEFGGEVHRLYVARKTPAEQMEERLREGSDVADTLTLGQMIRKIYDQLRASCVVVVEVPDAEQTEARRTLTMRAEETSTTPKGKTKVRPIEGRLRYTPTFESSRTVREKLPALIQSPIAPLRLLAAHELRNHWQDPALYAVLPQRAEVETHGVIRRVLFESQVAIDLKRLQVTASEIADEVERRTCRRRAYERLQALGEHAEVLPDPLLAEDAAFLARRTREEIQGESGTP
jgi:hypothetical protein